MKILVTGGGGFLGRYIVHQLMQEEHAVVAYQRSDHPDLREEGVDVRQGSLQDATVLAAAMQGCDAVIHTAAKAGVWGSPESYFQANVEGTRTVLKVMEQLGVRRLVHCSTPSVVFNGHAFNGEDETLPYGHSWLAPYPESKAIAEQLVLEWGRSGQGKAIALRPHLIWGIGDPHLMPVVIERSRSRRLRIVGDGSNRVDVTRVENAAAAHLCGLRALDRPSAVNRAYFISQGEPVVLWDWINGMLEQVGVDRLEKRISFRTAYRVGAVCEQLWKWIGKESVPPMTRFVATELAKSHWFSIEAARRELDYRPEAYPLEAGMEAYAAHYRRP